MCVDVEKNHAFLLDFALEPDVGVGGGCFVFSATAGDFDVEIVLDFLFCNGKNVLKFSIIGSFKLKIYRVVDDVFLVVIVVIVFVFIGVIAAVVIFGDDDVVFDVVFVVVDVDDFKR